MPCSVNRSASTKNAFGSITHLNRVSGVVAALITRHDVEVFGKEIDYLALTLIAPLRADYNDDF